MTDDGRQVMEDGRRKVCVNGYFRELTDDLKKKGMKIYPDPFAALQQSSSKTFPQSHLSLDSDSFIIS